MDDFKSYIQELEKMLSVLDEDDYQFIVRLYTIALRYLEKRGRY